MPDDGGDGKSIVITVIPAEAGIHGFINVKITYVWIPDKSIRE
jgi:hypothetical protein